MSKRPASRTGGARGQLHQSGLKARKRLGQNFLVDRVVLEKIVQAADIKPDDTIIEVGPGLGILTEELAKHAGRVIAVELDDNLALKLKNKLAGLPNLEVVNKDILSVSAEELLCGTGRYKVVANIPFYITSPILHHFILGLHRPELMVVMVQKEVAQAIAAVPGNMTAQAVSLQIFSRPTIITRVPAASFYPPPKVESAVLLFQMLAEPAVKVGDVDGFIKFVRAGFGAPRKQLRNSLSIGLNVETEVIAALLEKAGIDSQRRPESLALEEWGTLYAAALSEGIRN